METDKAALKCFQRACLTGKSHLAIDFIMRYVKDAKSLAAAITIANHHGRTNIARIIDNYARNLSDLEEEEQQQQQQQQQQEETGMQDDDTDYNNRRSNPVHSTSISTSSSASASTSTSGKSTGLKSALKSNDGGSSAASIKSTVSPPEDFPSAIGSMRPSSNRIAASSNTASISATGTGAKVKFSERNVTTMLYSPPNSGTQSERNGNDSEANVGDMNCVYPNGNNSSGYSSSLDRDAEEASFSRALAAEDDDGDDDVDGDDDGGHNDDNTNIRQTRSLKKLKNKHSSTCTTASPPIAPKKSSVANPFAVPVTSTTNSALTSSPVRMQSDALNKYKSYGNSNSTNAGMAAHHGHGGGGGGGGGHHKRKAVNLFDTVKTTLTASPSPIKRGAFKQ